jgi:hypothetical protein
MCVEGSDPQCYVNEDLEVTAKVPYEWLWAALQKYLFGIWRPKQFPAIVVGDQTAEPERGSGTGNPSTGTPSTGTGNTGNTGVLAATLRPPGTKRRTTGASRNRVCQAYLRDSPHMPNPSQSQAGSYRVKDGIGNGTFLSPSATANTAVKAALHTATAIGLLALGLEFAGVEVATGPGSTGLRLFTLTRGAAEAEHAMTASEIGMTVGEHVFGHEPSDSELVWVGWGDTTGCTP